MYVCVYIYCEQAEFGDFNEWEKNDCLRIFYMLVITESNYQKSCSNSKVICFN